MIFDKYRSIIFYVVTIVVFWFAMYFFMIEWQALQAQNTLLAINEWTSSWWNFIQVFQWNLHHPLSLLLLQILIIVFVAKLFWWLFTKIKQPSVVWEMFAWIILWPSLFWLFFPEFSWFLFPKESLWNLQMLSQVGLILFMFIVWMELDLNILRKKAQDAVVISHGSIIIPFALWIGLSYFLYQDFAPEWAQFLSFSLFIAISMSITAFPVLARIVQERNLQKTKVGTVAITCAAADDITAWCILAAVIAIVKVGSFQSSLYIIGLSIVYLLLMFQVIKPFLKKLFDKGETSDSYKWNIAIFFLVLILSSYITEVIGIHALFGAFVAWVVMPESIKFRENLMNKVQDVALILLLPLFFVFTWLRTEIGLLNDVHLWLITLWVIAVGILGKFFGSAFSAKFLGNSWKDSLTIGALMNTRWLMELIALNIWYDLWILSPEIFTILVIMALFTTFMTGPSLDFINYIFKSKDKKLGDTSL